MVRLSGVLVDKESGLGVPFTQVTLDANLTTTDSEGMFSFDVPAGSYTLRVRHANYAPVTMSIELMQDRNIKVEVVKTTL